MEIEFIEQKENKLFNRKEIKFYVDYDGEATPKILDIKSKLVALLNTFFRDLERLLQVILQIWFYVTPIFYSMGQIPERYHQLFSLNPLYEPLKLLRSTFYSPESCNVSALGALLCSCLFCCLAIGVFNRYGKKIAELL